MRNGLGIFPYANELLTALTVVFFGLGLTLATTPRNWESQYSEKKKRKRGGSSVLICSYSGGGLLLWWRFLGSALRSQRVTQT